MHFCQSKWDDYILFFFITNQNLCLNDVSDDKITSLNEETKTASELLDTE